MNKTKRIFLETGGLISYLSFFLINFFWYMILGEDTGLNTLPDYIIYILFYIVFSVSQIAFLTLSKGKVSKILLIAIGVLTFDLWLAGYQGAASVLKPEFGLVITRLIVLIVNMVVTVYAVIRLFYREKGIDVS